MADDERRAEIEAIERALRAAQDHMRNTPGIDPMRSLYAREIRDGLEALDRVRDARGDDEAARLDDERVALALEVGELRAKLKRAEAARSPQGEDHETCGHGGACVRPKGHTGSHSVHLEGTPFSVPQGEDHEAGIAAIIERWLASGKPTSRRNGVLVPDCVAEIMALLPPSRDGTVAVEDVATWRDVVAWLRKCRTAYHEDGLRWADFIEREFSPASTGDREEKKA